MPRNLLLLASANLLVLGLVTAPVHAADGVTVTSVNALPGTRIDVCVGGVEVASGLAYGRSLRHSLPLDASVIVRTAGSGTCKGTRLADPIHVTLAAGKEQSVVYWKPRRALRLTVFEDVMDVPGAGEATLVLRHVAKTPAIDGWLWQQVVMPTADGFAPTFDDLAKGQQSATVTLAARQMLIEAFPAGSKAGWSYEYLQAAASGDFAYQAYFMGNDRSNYRLVLVGRPGIIPPP
jgi:hypothetical protein